MWSTFRPAVAGALRAARGASTANRLTFAVSRARLSRTTPTGYVFNKQVRYLAAAAQGQVKATTSAATKKTPAKKAPAKKAPRAKKVAAKKKKPVVKKKKVAKKPVKKKVVKKVVKKPKVVLTPEQKRKALIKELTTRALIRELPKKLPTHAWTVLFSQNVLKGEVASKQLGAVSSRYKALSAPEIQALNEIGEKNKATNAANLKAWIETHTVLEIKAANNARNHLKRLGVKKELPRLADERMPKRPKSAYLYFSLARMGSGELGGKPVTDKTPAIAQEWQNLSEADRKPYHDLWKNETEQYHKRLDALGLTASGAAV